MGVISCRTEIQSFFYKIQPNTQHHGQGTHSASVVRPKLPKMPLYFSAQAQKFKIFEKKFSLAVRPLIRRTTFLMTILRYFNLYTPFFVNMSSNFVTSAFLHFKNIIIFFPGHFHIQALLHLRCFLRL